MPRHIAAPFLVVAVFALGCNRQPASTPPAAKTSVGGVATQAPTFVNLGDPLGRPNVKTSPSTPAVPSIPVAQGPVVELGELEQRPILFFDLKPGMQVRISNIKYDQLGWVESYEATSGDVKIAVRTETPAGGGRAPTYAATVNGKPVPKQSDKKLIGFAVKEATGTVVPGSSGNVKTKLGYEQSGRQYVAQQDFEHAGKTYSIKFAEYKWDVPGHLEGYLATVVKAE
jgi:hypothetical protein